MRIDITPPLESGRTINKGRFETVIQHLENSLLLGSLDKIEEAQFVLPNTENYCRALVVATGAALECEAQGMKCGFDPACRLMDYAIDRLTGKIRQVFTEEFQKVAHGSAQECINGLRKWLASPEEFRASNTPTCWFDGPDPKR